MLKLRRARETREADSVSRGRTRQGSHAQVKALLAFLFLVPMAAWADSPFDGTWVTKTDSVVMSQKPWVILLDKGIFQNESMVPPLKVKADGMDQPVSGYAGFDSMAVQIVGTDSVEFTAKKAGKVMGTNTFTVSSDGKTLTNKFSDQSGTTPATGEVLLTRVKSGPKGSNPVSGSWREAKLQDLSANGQTVTYKATADGLSMSAPTGQSYEAKFDGKYYPVAGDPSQTMVSLKHVNAHTIIETDKQLGKVVEVATMTVSPDGKSIRVSWEGKQTGRTGHYEMDKSP
jgi:hypothetical protein